MSSDLSSSGIENFSAPIGVFLNLTQQCNMRCPYCVAEAVRPKANPLELTDEEMLGLIDQLVAARVFRYVITGGEVFLRRELLFRVLERLQPFGTAVLTNASLITAADARRLAAFRNVSIALSIDAPTEEANARTRGRGFLARTLRGAWHLLEHGITPSVNCVVTRSNQHLMEGLVGLLESEGLKNLQIIHLQPVGRAREQEDLVLSCLERRAFSGEILALAARSNHVSVVAAEDKKWQSLEGALSSHREQGLPETPAKLLSCSAGVEQCNVTADGWVTPCNAMSSWRCGNIRERDFLSIWRESPRLQELRALRRTPVSAIQTCASCRYNPVCRGGCRAIGLAATGDLLGFDPSCPYGSVTAQARKPLLPVVH